MKKNKRITPDMYTHIRKEELERLKEIEKDVDKTIRLLRNSIFTALMMLSGYLLISGILFLAR